MRIRTFFTTLLLAALPAVAQIPTNRLVVLEGVPYEQPMWSRADPFGFTTLSNASLTASAAASTAAVGVALGPRVTSLEALTNLITQAYEAGVTNTASLASLVASVPFWDAAYQMGLTNGNAIAALQGLSASWAQALALSETNASLIAALRASSPLWDAAYAMGLTNNNAIAILNGRTADWDSALAIAQTNSARLGVIDGLSPSWTAAYNMAATNNSRLNVLEQLRPTWDAAYAQALSNLNSITTLQGYVTALPGTAYVDSQDALDRAYAFALFNGLTDTNNAAMTARLVDHYNPVYSWLEYTSNVVYQVSVTAPYTNYQWYAWSTAPLSVTAGIGYDTDHQPVAGSTLVPAFTTNAVTGATNAIFCYVPPNTGAVFPASTPVDDTELAFVSSAQYLDNVTSRVTVAWRRLYSGAYYYSTPGTMTQGYYASGNEALLLSAVVTPAAGVLSNQTSTAYFPGFFAGDATSGGNPYYTSLEAGSQIGVTRVDTVIAAVTNRTALLSFTNGLWAAIINSTNTTLGLINVHNTNILAHTNLVPYTGATTAVNLGTNVLTSADSAASVDPDGRKLYAPNGTLMLDWHDSSYGLTAGAGLYALDIGSGTLIDYVSASLDWVGHHLISTGSGNYGKTIDWEARTLITRTGDDFNGTVALDWASRDLYDASNITALNWAYRGLYFSDTAEALNWYTPGLITAGTNTVSAGRFTGDSVTIAGTNLQTTLEGKVGTDTTITVGMQSGKLATNLTFSAWQNPLSSTNWTWTSDGREITITNYTGSNEVVIPDMLDGLPVTAITNSVFVNKPIISISGGNNIKNIGSFYNCVQLVSVSLPNVVNIGVDAFVGGSMTNLSFPNATSVGDYAFVFCDRMTHIYLPKLETIGIEAFRDCVALTSVTFSGNAPTGATNVFISFPPNQVTIYVDNPTATGWGATWNGMPVVQMPVYADSVTIAGTNLQTTLAGKVDTNHTGNVSIAGSLTVTNNVLANDFHITSTNFSIPSYNTNYYTKGEVDAMVFTPVTSVSPVANVVTIIPTRAKKVYDVTASSAITLFTNNLSGLTLNGTEKVEWESRINYTVTNALSTAWESRIEWINGTPDLTVTGRYEFAFSTSDGVTIQGRQVYPTVHDWRKSIMCDGNNVANNTSFSVAWNRLLTGTTGTATITNAYVFAMLPFEVSASDYYVRAKVYSAAGATVNNDVWFGVSMVYQYSTIQYFDYPTSATVANNTDVSFGTYVLYRPNSDYTSGRFSPFIAIKAIYPGATNSVPSVELTDIQVRKINELEKKHLGR